MVGRSSDVYLSIFEVIRTETAQDSSTSYSVAVQEIDLPKKVIIRSYLFILRDSILYSWYWSLVYTCTMDHTNGEFIFPKFSIMVFKSVKTRIYYKVSQMFRKAYKCFYGIVQK